MGIWGFILVALFVYLPVSSPAWMPIVFLAYAIGKKKVGLRFFFCILAVEAVGLTYALFVWTHIDELIDWLAPWVPSS